MEKSATQALAVTKTDTALANIRSRALDLHARLLELRDSVAMLRDGIGPCRNASWSTFLNKFETLARLYHQLTEELDRAVTESGFENYLLQPKAVADDPELVPNLLRTKLEPDVESDLDKLNKSYIDDVDGTDQSAESLESRISSFNSFVLAAVERYEDAREDLLVNPRPVESPPQMPSANAQALLTALSSGAPIP